MGLSILQSVHYTVCYKNLTAEYRMCKTINFYDSFIHLCFYFLKTVLSIPNLSRPFFTSGLLIKSFQSNPER